MNKREQLMVFGKHLEHYCPYCNYELINKNSIEFKKCKCFKWNKNEYEKQ